MLAKLKYYLQKSGPAIFEMVKFGLREVVLIGGPFLVDYLMHLDGFWGGFFTRELPIILPLADKYFHENKRIPVRGILPF